MHHPGVVTGHHLLCPTVFRFLLTHPVFWSIGHNLDVFLTFANGVSDLLSQIIKCPDTEILRLVFLLVGGQVEICNPFPRLSFSVPSVIYNVSYELTLFVLAFR